MLFETTDKEGASIEGLIGDPVLDVIGAALDGVRDAYLELVGRQPFEIEIRQSFEMVLGAMVASGELDIPEQEEAKE